MNKTFMTSLMVLVSKLIQGAGSYRDAAMDIAKLKIATRYLQAVKVSRLLFLSILASGLCLIFLLAGLVLLHCAIFFYAPWGAGVKAIVTVICAVVYISIAAGIFAYIFAEERWLKIFNADKMVKELVSPKN